MKKSKEELKKYFETGDKPTQAEYSDLIDSYIDAKQPVGESNRTFIINENGEVNLVGQQSDWAQTDASQPDYIKNKPEVEKTIIIPTRNYVLKSNVAASVNGTVYECKVPSYKFYEGSLQSERQYFMSADFYVYGKTSKEGEIAVEFLATTSEGEIISEKIGLLTDNIEDTGKPGVRINAIKSFFGNTLLRSLRCNVIINTPDSPTVFVSNIYFGVGNVVVDWNPASEDHVVSQQFPTTN
ncbi:hypothetical protein ACSIGC_11235 [Tenacibaculum sp. ZS6-P6]|uniref:hypothetical protein n=1 Tax=Tenacibaculum sp. ZS6-P6 TaxID=3447503 RepID=UPI003F9562DB